MRRWIRLDVGWDDSEWISLLSPGAQLAWIKMLVHCKRDGVNGTCKAINHAVAARRWGVPREAIDELVEAGRIEGAILLQRGNWILTTWTKYQGDPTNADRQRRYRARQRNVT